MLKPAFAAAQAPFPPFAFLIKTLIMRDILTRSCDIIVEALLRAFLPVYLVYFGSLDQCTGQVLDSDSALRPIAPPLLWLLTYLRKETNILC